MPKPKGKKNNKEIKLNTNKVIDNNKKIACFGCQELKEKKYFYVSYNKLHITGKLPYCTDCLKKMICDEQGNVTLEKVQDTLQKVDLPFIYNLWQSSMEEEGDTFGNYKKNLALNFKYLTWKDSIFLPEADNKPNYENMKVEEVKKVDFEVTHDMILKWGVGYENEEYCAFERKYHFLKNNYPEKTSMHTEALLKYIRYSVKEEISTAKNNVGEAKSWGALAKDAATAAKINPSQLSAADLQDGLSTFGQLARAVEQAKDIVLILPQFKEKPQDKVDFTLWCYINYVRDLKGLPPCEYKDIYKFYEDRKKQYEERINDSIDAEGQGDE